jgi:type IV pilus assembly protein PilV
MPMIPRNDSRSAAAVRAGGFTLIEVLVALIVTCIGLLGIAKIQALVYANTGSASTRSLVAIQASGLAATMHANRVYWSAGAAPSPVTITNVTISESTNTLNTTATGVTDCNSGGALAPCTPAVLAAFDLHTWARGLSGLLPGVTPTTVITCPPVSIPLTCTIQVTWSEKTVSLNTQAQAGTVQGATGTFAPTYTLYVEP